PADRGERKWCHELRPALAQDHAEGEAALAPAPDQLQRLLGGDAARDDQEDACGRGHAGKFHSAALYLMWNDSACKVAQPSLLLPSSPGLDPAIQVPDGTDERNLDDRIGPLRGRPVMTFGGGAGGPPKAPSGCVRAGCPPARRAIRRCSARCG